MGSQFDVNIRTTGDTSGSEKVEQSLDRVEQKAAAANAGATPGASVPLDRSSLDAQLEREASIRQQILGTETEITAKEAERNALQERLASLTTQRQILIDVETERVQALAAGDTERAAALQADLQLRQLSLQLQTSGVLSEEEALAIAQQRLAAEAEIAAAQEAQAGASLLAGANIGKARNEAITFGRELASGAASGRTLSSLLGAFGPQIAIASIGIFALVKNFGKVQEVIQAISDGIQGVNGKDLATAITKADEFAIAMRKAGDESSEQLSAGIQKLQDELVGLTDKYREAVVANDDKLAASLEEQISAKKSLLDFDRFSLDIAQATEGIEALKARDIKASQDARREELALQKEGLDLDQQFRQAQDASLSDNDKLIAYRSRIEEIKTTLQGLGVAADSPNAAFVKSIGLADAQRNEIVKLATEWQNLSVQVAKGSADQQRQSDELVTKLQEVEKEAAKPNISVEERLKLLQQELDLLGKIKQSEIDRAQAAAAAHPAEAARIADINQQLAQRSSAPDFGTPEAADRSASLLNERSTLSQATGIPEDVQQLTKALDDQSSQITKVIDATKTGAGDVTVKVGDLDAAVSAGFKSFTDTLQPIPEKVTTAASGVNEKIGNLGATTQAGFEAIGAAVASVQASLQRTIDAQSARIGALERR